MITDLEDTVLMVENVSSDIVSDIVTNIIRGPLIDYTQSACQQYGIPLYDDIDSGPIWDANTGAWTNRFVKLPVAAEEKLLLVPKIIVRHDMDYDVEKYYRGYILEYLKDVEINANTDLVHILKSGKRKGTPKVYKKDLKQKYGSGKSTVVDQTVANPELLRQYKEANKEPTKPLTHRELADAENAAPPDWDRLFSEVKTLKAGNTTAGKYEKAVESLLSGLFYPYLSNPIFQDRIHAGRKIIDITYSNSAHSGFFFWLSLHYPSAYIHVECKNYNDDLSNPELDQISSRFAPNRGKVGIIVCRAFADKQLWRKRCHDTATDGRGFILTLDDDDLASLVAARKVSPTYEDFPLLKGQFDALVR